MLSRYSEARHARIRTFRTTFCPVVIGRAKFNVFAVRAKELIEGRRVVPADRLDHLPVDGFVIILHQYSFTISAAW